MNFYELAIRTGRNVYPSVFNNWFTGGLNFQIEVTNLSLHLKHHMFPTVPRHNLPQTSEMIKALCKKHDILYHSTSFGAGMKEVVDRLGNVAKHAQTGLKLE